MEYKEVQRLLRCNRVTIWRYVKSGKIRIEKINDYHYIYNDDDVYRLEEYALIEKRSYMQEYQPQNRKKI